MAPTFASAAAGNSANSSRGDSGGDWGRRANGATQTFRRPSHATTLSGSTTAATSRDGSGSLNASSSNPGIYVPPHAQSGRNGSVVEGRYSRSQLLQLFQEQQASDELRDGLSSLFVGSWEPNISNGTSSASWGRRDDHGREGQGGVDLCWDKDGGILPLSLNELTEEEKETFTSSVNSPLKPPAQNPNKEGTPKEGLSLRKSSISQGAGAYGLSSPTSTRPSARRRDTNEYPFPSNNLASPAGASRFPRDESSAVTPPPALVRRRTDFKEQGPGGGPEERDREKAGAENAAPFGSLKRTTTAPMNPAIGQSPWSSSSPMGAFGSFANPQSEKKAGFGSLRGESRFKGLMGKASTEELDNTAKEKSSIGNLARVSEAEGSRQSNSWMEARSNRPTSNDTDPFPDDEYRSGSAALGGGQDLSPARPQGLGAFTTPHKQDHRDDTGFSAFGMTAGNAGLRDIFQGRDNFSHQTPQHRGDPSQEPMSPTDTNPYQSPEHTKGDNDDAESDGSDIQNTQFPGMGSFQVDPPVGAGLHAYGGLVGLNRGPAAFEPPPSDRSQTSSTGPRAFPSLPGLGTLPGLGGSTTWSSGQQAIGTPVREKGHGGGFDSMYNSGELQSPSHTGLGSSALFGGGSAFGGSGTMGRTSRLGSLFPLAMQDQMRVDQQHRQSVDEGSTDGERLAGLTGTFGRGAFSQAPGGAVPARDTDSPFRSGRGVFDAFTGGLDGGSQGLRTSDHDPIAAAFGQASGAASSSVLGTSAQHAIGQTRTAQPSASSQPPSVSSPASSQPPPPQQRTMVMPDRMRWIYRDPQGNTQGPWTGLEMHDWYKAGFFSPELLVKKYEDPDYEPLAQLIRRIGNSREPFLVPQIGIPHGPATSQPGNSWGAAGPPTGATAPIGAAAGAQPPFANSFPSFGTTLTAEQQNALERRKQEEQYLMARQKEHLAAQQAMAKQAQLGMGPHGMLPHQLHHHSSAHSLHSQPSYGSITSPGGYQPSPTQAPIPGGPAVPGLFENTFRPGPVPGLGPIGGSGLDVLGNIREEELPAGMDRLNLGRTGQPPFGTAPVPFGQQQPDSNAHAQQVAAMLNDRARLQREQAEYDVTQRAPHNEQQAAQASADRLQQFQDLRLQTDLEHPTTAPPPEGIIGKPFASSLEPREHHEDFNLPEPRYQQHASYAEDVPQPKSEHLSLTEQVQKAASSKQSPAPQSPWQKVEPVIHPFPPPPSQSPLPAPAAQRKPIVADSLAGESRPETPSAETPSASLAPWAKEPAEAPRGPSLKEIQEAEARKAAEREAIAAAARREAAEKEFMSVAQSTTVQPGLPATSTWGSGASPSTPSGASPSVWSAKPLASKTTGTQSSAKKTLQQIQKEEEARKQRAAATAITASAFGAASQNLSSGKRYADLASKHTPAPPGINTLGGAWTTVGASGKVKTPGGAAPPAPSVLRSASGGVIPPVVTKKPTVTRNTTMSSQLGRANAEEEFRKWAVGELGHDLKKGINADEFVSTLLSFPADIEIITETVHSASSTVDSRHFAEEFLRRRKLADKGLIDNTTPATPVELKSGSGGWNEVAKKGGPSTQQQQGPLDSGNFKVVAAKKKGAKR
ncbi:hypothetical protein BDV96DRAFT_554111 [Lophiotrema nucula]|uniref:GYF domain-containing protein n=1 Tax=Lophiotrema nucula TaxID=690887 RepID=A0A6A5YRY9_9PLEO|nr:hypothetical protein BDV96DRAFT_554111 [Lophiotrema nucula]